MPAMSVCCAVMVCKPLVMLAVLPKLQLPVLLTLAVPSTVATPPTVSVRVTVAPASPVPLSTGWAVKLLNAVMTGAAAVVSRVSLNMELNKLWLPAVSC